MDRVMKVAWMYHDIMDLYGDTGNMMVLKKRCEDRDIQFVLHTIGIGQEADLNDYNLIFLGGGADKEQMSIIPDLLSRKENIKEAMDNHTFVLLICGGYQLFGQYYEAADKTQIPGLGFYNYHTDTGKEGARCIGNVVVDAILDGFETKIIGFENHGGQTVNVDHPLGKVIKGYGNSFEAGYEGFYDGKILGTYLHGPLLPKNPDIADFVITKALQKNDPDFKFSDLKKLDDIWETRAREAILSKLDIQN